MNQNPPKHRFGMLWMFIALVFGAMLVSMSLTCIAAYLLIKLGVLSTSAESAPHMSRLIEIMALVSVPVGMTVAVVVGKVPLRPMRDLVASMNQLAAGNFKTRIRVGPVMRRFPAFVEVAESFNKMAEELENTEMLRGDFINNFSHEFKTPIVSITGFAKLLNRGGLSPEQQKEYLQVIEEESLRLSYMATNVLNLTKVENQTILTGVTEFNLSEQIRSCILLLENKWEKKDLDFRLSFGEHRIHANEELLKQVWINLLDNAIKFSPAGGTVEVRIVEAERIYAVSVVNSGSTISPEHQKKIFNKFYQADESHAAEGNGVGLAIVKQVVCLHGGSVWVNSENDVTIFTAALPK